MTPAPLPPEEIERLKTLLEKATKGGWSRNIRPISRYPVIFAGRNTHVLQIVSSRAVPEGEAEANADLVTAAISALPALLAEIEAGRAGAERVRGYIPRLPVEKCGITKQALIDIEGAIGGSYVLADGRKFWMDAGCVREIMQRIIPYIGAECERHRQVAELAALRQAAQPSDGALSPDERQAWWTADEVIEKARHLWAAQQSDEQESTPFQDGYEAGMIAAAEAVRTQAKVMLRYRSATTPAAPAQVGAQPAGWVEPTYWWCGHCGCKLLGSGSDLCGTCRLLDDDQMFEDRERGG